MTRLPPQPWIHAAPTRRVLDALEAEGGEGCARFVGGAVRNALMGLEVADVDIATPLTPERVIAALKRADIRAVPTGIEHGTVTAVADHAPFEITTLRRDVSTDGRNATVAFSTDWAEDAMRRDFRLNALYADREGTVFDPVGGGVKDALAGRIVFVGDAETRIREDYLRILRFFRFFAWYGRGEPDAAALAACAGLKDGMVRLSAERVSKELLKTLAAPDPRAAVRLMDRTGVLRRVVPRPDLTRFEAMVPLGTDPLLRLSAVLPDEREEVAALASGLRLSNEERDRLLAALPDRERVDLDLTPPQARAALYRLGARTFADRVTRLWAEAGPQGEARARALLTLARDWTRPRFPLGGAEVAALGVSPGPETGRLLKAAEAWWIENDFPEHGARERLADLAGRLPPQGGEGDA
ncbi:MAG TPA: CCA tRNA nucleotidyltransferase [Caulobacteraceae bacterium]|nr:CCA tRNA nucleotidyltransferase [Caulobacteraceae bacterium]